MNTRQKILNILSDAGGGWVSREEIQRKIMLKKHMIDQAVIDLVAQNKIVAKSRIPLTSRYQSLAVGIGRPQA